MENVTFYDTNNKKLPYQIVSIEDEGTVYASIHSNIYDERLNQDEAKENAQFICKAVNLHSELIEALKKIAVHDKDWDLKLDRSDAKGFVKIAREALNKAGIEAQS